MVFCRLSNWSAWSLYNLQIPTGGNCILLPVTGYAHAYDHRRSIDSVNTTAGQVTLPYRTIPRSMLPCNHLTGVDRDRFALGSASSSLIASCVHALTVCHLTQRRFSELNKHTVRICFDFAWTPTHLQTSPKMSSSAFRVSNYVL